MFFFFFFKQKTAYEMRISDWSSDVCSSDLLRCAGRGCTVPFSELCLDFLHACARQRVIPDNDGAADQAERGSNGHGELETENAAGRLHGGRRIEDRKSVV